MELRFAIHITRKILKSEKTTCNSKTAMIQYDSLFERTGSHKTITSHGSELIFKKMKKLLTRKRSHDILSELLLRNTKQQRRPARQEHIERCDENSQSNSDNQIEMQP